MGWYDHLLLENVPQWEKMKKDEHKQHCHDQRKKTLFFISADEILGKEAQVVLITLSQLMAAKMEEPISHVKGWVNGRIVITIAMSLPFPILMSTLLVILTLYCFC